MHDVDCIAGVLTLRRGRHSSTLEDAHAVFATDSAIVIRKVQTWWTEVERETGIAPIVHIRALINLAWLKKPSLCADLKIQELIALCSAALSPKQATWERFLRHLGNLKRSGKITSDEDAAMLVSRMSDHLLVEAELDSDDPDDIDAVTLDEVVERVKASYATSSEEKIQSMSKNFETRIAQIDQEKRAAVERAEAAERAAAAEARRRAISIEDRAGKWAGRLVTCGKYAANALLIIAACELILGHPFHRGWIGVALGIALIFAVVLEFIGWKKHVSEWLREAEVRLKEVFFDWLGGNI